MELDDLKQQWKQSENIHQSKNSNIMDIIRHKSNGPLAELKRSYRWQMAMMAVMPVFIITTNISHIDKTLSSALFWFYIVFCTGVILFARMNYNTVKKMEGQDSMVKSKLEEQIALLEKRQRQKLTGIRVAMLFFILLLEVLPYLQHFTMLNKWHALSPFIRFGGYAALVLWQYWVTRRVSQANFGKSIARLKELVKEMQ